MRKKTLRLACAAVAAMMLLTACSASADKAETAAGGTGGAASAGAAGSVKDTITKRQIADQTTFDPYKSADQNSWELMYDIYDTLFREEADGSYVPNLCTEYSFKEDGTELTMKLVEGVKFQNGDVMTVDDVVFSLNTSIASSFTTKFTSSMKEAVKVDDNTVKLVLK